MELLNITFDDIKNKFSIINATSIFDHLQINEEKINNIYEEIEKYEKNTGIMIVNLYISSQIAIYLFILDYHIIIIEENDLKPFFLIKLANMSIFI